MIYVIGLGNPGLKYTRHNVGFMLLDMLAREYSFPEFKQKFSGLISTGNVFNNKVTLFKPYTFMNNSGIPLLKLVSFYKISSQEIIVVHDDVDLIFGKIKIKQDGGNGGHNGLKSIDKNVDNNYWRLRIGIGRPVIGNLADYVLSKFANNENIENILKNISLHFKLLLSKDKNLFIQKLTNI